MKVRDELIEGEESWIKQYWRPAMAWSYFLVCLFDFLIAPSVMVAISVATKTPYVAWEPLTLGLSGFYHISMGSIIGVTAWTRGMEKIKQIEMTSVETPPNQEGN